MRNNNLTPVVVLRDGTELPAVWVNDTNLAQGEIKPNDESERLFYSNIPLFYANIERIFSDSKLFLTPVYIRNGLAISGNSGFQHPTLGIYIEWWLFDNNASTDIHGNPIWKIAASGLSSGHACKAVNEHGEPINAILRGRTSETWKTFMAENKRYKNEKKQFQSYSLEEAIEILQNE